MKKQSLLENYLSELNVPKQMHSRPELFLDHCWTALNLEDVYYRESSKCDKLVIFDRRKKLLVKMCFLRANIKHEQMLYNCARSLYIKYGHSNKLKEFDEDFNKHHSLFRDKEKLKILSKQLRELN